MNTLEAIAKRVSVREYKPEQISEEALGIILDAGCSAPVASGKYDSLHITVVQTQEHLQRIMDTASDMVYKIMRVKKNMDFGAKTLVIVSSMPAALPGLEYANAACVLENMILAATALNIDNIIWGAAAAAVAQDESLKDQLGIPNGYTPLLCASFGYAVNAEPAKNHTISVNRI